MRKNKTHADPRRKLPAVGRFLEAPPVQALLTEGVPRDLILEEIRSVLEEARHRMNQEMSPLSPFSSQSTKTSEFDPILQDGKGHEKPFEADDGSLWKSLLSEVEAKARGRWQGGLQPVLNGTGILLHTNLGRAPLAREALEAIWRIAEGYSDLEYNRLERTRGERNGGIEGLFQTLVGAEAALVVNNNAAAVWLALQGLAAGREVIVSRGELVEIGGSFRIPAIMEGAGVRLREVGTTNRTYARDYEAAITPQTAALVKIHPSNFSMQGFVHETSLEEIAALGQKHRLVTFLDLGSGLLRPLSILGGKAEISVFEALQKGIDLVAFSGDKLLGGPQSGILLGKKEILAKLKYHPMMRVLRICKLTLAALEATLRIYLAGEEAVFARVPLFRMLGQTQDDLEEWGRILCKAWQEPFQSQGIHLHLQETRGQIGGGTTPATSIPSWRLGFRPSQAGPSLDAIERRWRLAPLAVLGFFEDGCFWLDLRTILPEQRPLFQKALDSFLANLPDRLFEASGV